TFHGYDFDSTMLRIGSMNMLLHGVENPDIRYRDSLAQPDQDDAEQFSLILANPPFAGSLDYESTSKDLLKIVKTKRTELLFLALFLRLLQTGGGRPSSCRTECSLVRPGPTKRCEQFWSRTKGLTQLFRCHRGYSGPTRASP